MTRKDYHQNAAECVRLAEQTDDHVAKLTYIGLARAWLGLADLAEKNERTDLVYETPQKSSHAE